MNEFKNLLSPIKINGMIVKNRIFMSPMGSLTGTDKGEITEATLQYYENAAQGGMGLITIEGVDVDGHRRYNPNMLGIFDDNSIKGWTKLVDVIHKHGVKATIQIQHSGPIPLFTGPTQTEPVGPSTVPHNYDISVFPRALKKEELGNIKQLFVDAARRAVEAGFDAIEIHCAHSHSLLGQFVSPLHNKRTDEYGGNFFGRMKFPVEVITAVRKSLPEDYPISVRMSAAHLEDGGMTIEESCRMAKVFEKAGIDFFDISRGSSADLGSIIPPSGIPKAWNADYSKQIKEVVNVPVGVVGRVNDPWIAEEVLEFGKADMVYMGRALLCDPQLPNKIMENRAEEIRPCVGCSECITAALQNQPILCTLNSEVGRETEKIVPATAKKKVLIAGGGPGGLEAARVAKLRGFDVTLMEKSDQLGGQFTIASYPPMKQEFACGLKHMIDEVYRLGVNVELNKTVTKEVVKEYGADAVIVATGGTPIIPGWLKNCDHENVTTAWDSLKGNSKIGKDILIIGGGLVGCETADYLAESHYYMQQGGKKVTVIEMAKDVMAEDLTANRDLLIRRLLEKNVTLLTGAKVEKVTADGIIYSVNGVETELNNIDTIVSSVGTRSENSLIEELNELSVDVIAVGDAVKPRKIWKAVDEGARAAKSI